MMLAPPVEDDKEERKKDKETTAGQEYEIVSHLDAQKLGLLRIIC